MLLTSLNIAIPFAYTWLIPFLERKWLIDRKRVWLCKVILICHTSVTLTLVWRESPLSPVCVVCRTQASDLGQFGQLCLWPNQLWALPEAECAGLVPRWVSVANMCTCVVSRSRPLSRLHFYMMTSSGGDLPDRWRHHIKWRGGSGRLRETSTCGLSQVCACDRINHQLYVLVC